MVIRTRSLTGYTYRDNPKVKEFQEETKNLVKNKANPYLQIMFLIFISTISRDKEPSLKESHILPSKCPKKLHPAQSII